MIEGITLQVGQLVIHPKRTEWGPGKVLVVDGSKLTVFFRDHPEPDPSKAATKIDTKWVQLELAREQTDPYLDSLPHFENDKFPKWRRRVSFEEALEAFHKRYPLYFEDLEYIGDLKKGERAYKWAAHELFEKTLGQGEAESLLGSGNLSELRKRILAVDQAHNLTFSFEKMAFRDGLKDDPAAEALFRSLFSLLGEPQAAQEVFENYLKALSNLPVEEGKHPVAKWPVLTVLPFLAQPNRHMFLKPKVTKECADRLPFDLSYRSELNWQTYRRLLEMSRLLLERLRPYGARDFIDVQSFIWLVGELT